jgi:hypothetical protein
VGVSQDEIGQEEKEPKATVISRAMGHGSVQTTERHHVHLREQNMFRELNDLFVPESKEVLEKPKTSQNKMIENDRYLSGYA